MKRVGEFEIFCVTFLGSNVINHVSIFGSGMHPSHFVMIGLLIMCDGEIEFLSEIK